MAGATVLLRCCGLLAAGLLLVACSGGEDNTDMEKSARSSGTANSPGADPGSSPSAGSGSANGAAPAPSATGFSFTPDPGRIPRTRADALRLARAIAGPPGRWGPGYVARTPYEGATTSWPVLDRGCVWQLAPLPKDVLASLTRYSELPARGGKGPLRIAAIVTVHRDTEAADWEMAGTLEEALRCPDQQLREDERLSGLISESNTYGKLENFSSDDRLAESGQYYSDKLGGPHPYFWSQARIGQVTVTAVGKGSKGHTQEEVDDGMARGMASMLGAVGEELQAAR